MGITFKIFKMYVNKIIQNINIVSNVSFVIFVYFVIRYSSPSWIKDFLWIVGYFILIMGVQSFDRYYKSEHKKTDFPIVKKRFTKKLDDEMIVIKKSDWEEAVLYLSEVEDYLGK